MHAFDLYSEMFYLSANSEGFRMCATYGCARNIMYVRACICIWVKAEIRILERFVTRLVYAQSNFLKWNLFLPYSVARLLVKLEFAESHKNPISPEYTLTAYSISIEYTLQFE